MEKALALAYRFLSFRPRTVFEVETYLKKKAQTYAFTPDEIQAVIELLKGQDFLNDATFIKSFVGSRNTLKPKSKRVLMMELKKCGVSPADINDYFSQNETNEDELALLALRKKMKALQNISDEKKRFIKAISFLQRRGFSYDIAKNTYRQLND